MQRLPVIGQTFTHSAFEAVQHAVAVHQHQDTPELRDMIRQHLKEGTPPVESPAHA